MRGLCPWVRSTGAAVGTVAEPHTGIVVEPHMGIMVGPHTVADPRQPWVQLHRAPAGTGMSWRDDPELHQSSKASGRAVVDADEPCHPLERGPTGWRMRAGTCS